MAGRQSARMRDSEFNNDYMSRYERTLPVDSRRAGKYSRPSESGRLEREIRMKPEDSLASWVWNFDQVETRLMSLVNRGKYADAKKYYDEVSSVIDVNYNRLLDLTAAAGMGEVGQEMARRASRIVNNGFLDRQVNFGGSQLTLGMLVKDGGRLAVDAARDEFESLGLTGTAAEMMFNGSDSQRAVMKSLINPLLDGDGRSKITPAERTQRVDMAEDVVNHWDELESLFGDGTAYFVTRLQALHADAGGVSDTMRALMKCAETASAAKNLTGKDLARDVISGYSDLTAKVFARDTSKLDGNGRPVQDAITPSKRMAFDAALSSAVNALSARGASADLSGAAFTAALTEVMDAQAFAAESGIDLVAIGHDVGKSAKNAFGEYVADRATGTPVLDANPINAFMSVRNMLSTQVTGCNDFLVQAYRPSGNAQDYAASLNKTNGGYSRSFGADGMAYGVKSYLLQKMAPGIMAGKSASDALDSAMSGDLYSGTDFLVGLSNIISRHLSGPGRERAGDLLAASIMDSVKAGRGASMEGAVYDLVVAGDKSTADADAITSLSNWYYGNIAEGDRFAQGAAALRAHYRDHEKLPEHTSAYLVGKVLSKAAELERNGVDGQAAIDAARKNGTYYYTVADPATGQPTRDQYGNVNVVKNIGDLTEVGYQLDGDNSAWEANQSALAEMFADNRRFTQAMKTAAGRTEATESV